MPDIKIKHVVSFSSEDKIHKAENMMKPETYRKWKCATPGEKNATIVLQFEKPTQIHSIDIGNESSAFVEILVGRFSDSLNNFQVLLVASSFMSPLESRNETHTNRVRMFGPEKLSQQLIKEKWDCVQIVCTQPFNKNITYGLSFITFHSPPEKMEQSKQSETNATDVKLGSFKMKSDEDTDLSVGTWFGKRKHESNTTEGSVAQTAPSYASLALATDSSPKNTAQNNSLKRKLDEVKNCLQPPSKKESLDSSASQSNQKTVSSPKIVSSPKTVSSPKIVSSPKTVSSPKPLTKNAGKTSDKNVPKTVDKKASSQNNKDSQVTTNADQTAKKPFDKIMENVVFVLSGFVNPQRSQLRDKALQMGAKYKNDWDQSCTHLICAFTNTPKYEQVLKRNGKIVTKDWINDCYAKKTLLPWKSYLLGRWIAKDSGDEYDDSSDEYKPDKNESESDDSEFLSEASESESEDSRSDSESRHKRKTKKSKTESTKRKKQTNGRSLNKKFDEESKGSSKGPDKKQSSPKKASGIFSQVNGKNKDDSETEDEEAIEDYMANTDVDSDTENKIRDVKQKSNRDQESCKETNYPTKSEIDNLPYPALPSFFKKRHFFLYGNFASEIQHKLERYITAYDGILADYMSENVKYVISESKWDKNFEEALTENEDLLFVRAQWIFKCHEAKKIVPYQPYIIIPNS